MKIYSQAYKTYDGARKRMLLEKATNPGRFVWGVHLKGPEQFHVTRQLRKEFERELAISAAVVALNLDGE
jgi:hypothetical protein